MTINSELLLAGIQNGDDAAASAAFDRYVERLIALVRARIGPKLGRRIDADDVVQSTYRSFFVHAKNGEYRLTNSGDLWRLLASIALHKLYGQVERHTAARRSIAREEATDELANHHAVNATPTGAEVVAITEQLQLISKRLSPAQRTVLIAYLQGDSLEAIAESLGQSPRTVRRLLTQVRNEFEQELFSHTSATTSPEDYLESATTALAPLAYADFVLERLIGAGGMGKVYRATNRITGQPVAIKTLLKSRQRNRTVVAKFLQECQILSKLQHPNIVAFHGAGRFPGGGYFFVMDFVAGGDLQAQITRGALPISESLAIVRSAAAAIGFAHAHGIVHGDLKPANVLIDAARRVIVTDFGLAQFIDSAKTSPPRLIGGTAGFIAPEVHALGSLPTTAADIYGLGALLVALITGEPPIEPHRIGFATPLATEIQKLCAKCLARDPKDRYRSTDELLVALNRLQKASETRLSDGI